ncbi:PEP-CTERM sorting domain-containing protein [Tundrisphaera sp. TA3]|uniref:PEP-CTERM sorting domain-containing protein n=1 Tax=Tundrisphaera sp. TA3 TaxID=3435775 RepID=UPI003EBD1157
MLRIAKLALACTALALVAAPANAGFVPVFQSAVFSSGTNSTTISYSLNFTSNGATETLGSGNFLTIYDIAPTALTAVTTPATLTFSTTTTGVTPPLVGPTDNPALNNITYTYTGSTLTTDTTFTVSFSVAGNYTFGTRIGQYGSTDNIALGTNNQVGPVAIPTAVPEPASLAMVGLGLAGLGIVARRRRSIA